MSRTIVRAFAAALLTAAAVQAAGPEGAGGWIERGAPAGSRLHGRFRLAASLATLDGDRSSPALSLSLSGSWSAIVVASAPERTTLRAAIEAPSLELAGPDAAALAGAGELARLREHFTRPYLLVVGADGAVLEARMAPDTSGLVQGTLRSMAALIQLVEPPGAPASWTAEEVDTTGLATARYRRLGDGTVLKERVGYRWVAGGQSAAAPADAKVEILRSATSFSQPGGSARVLVEARERIRFAGSPPLPSLESSVELHFELTGKDRIEVSTEETEQWARGLVGGPLHAGPSDEAIEYELDRVKIGDLGFDEVLARLATLGDGEADRRAEGRLYLALTAMLRRDPGTLRSAIDHVRAQGPWTATLILALGHAGHPEAQAALLDVVAASPSGDDRRWRAALALSFVAKPTPRTVDGLTALVDDAEIGTQALYGLGAAAYQLRERDPELAGRAVGVLLGRLPSAPSPGRPGAARTLLRALGNAGHPASLDRLGPYLEAGDPSIREEAVHALRRLPDPEADRLLAERAAADESPRVREAAHSLLRRRAAPARP